MKKFIYPAVFYPELNSQYTVSFPDFGGATYGNDLADALDMAVDYLRGIIIAMQGDREKLPPPSDIGEVKTDEYNNGSAKLIAVVMD